MRRERERERVPPASSYLSRQLFLLFLPVLPPRFRQSTPSFPKYPRAPLRKIGLVMVSLRRRRLLGLCSGKDSIPVQIPGSVENGDMVENPTKNVKQFSVHPLPSFMFNYQKRTNISEASHASSNVSASSSSKEDTGKKVKRRKRHRRKHYDDQEPCIMRGVYFKNMKWQAAIKVDKKQIHLGTVGSQEEAARLYDRAAFMCGREPNFDLAEEEKQELRQYKWEEFLALTRNAISSKKNQRRVGVRGRPKKTTTELNSSDYDPERATGGSSMSDNEEEGEEISV